MTDYSRWLVSISSPLAGCSILNIIVSCLLSINRSFLKHFCQYWTIFAMPPGRKVDRKKSKKNIWKTSITWFSQKNVAALERSNRKNPNYILYLDPFQNDCNDFTELMNCNFSMAEKTEAVPWNCTYSCNILYCCTWDFEIQIFESSENIMKQSCFMKWHFLFILYIIIDVIKTTWQLYNSGQ